jgi:hypothetical protein
MSMHAALDELVPEFERALLDAKSIAFTTAGASGVCFAVVIERPGIVAQVQAKGMAPVPAATWRCHGRGI